VDETGAVLDPCPPLPEVDGFDGQVVPGLASGVAGVGEFLLFLTLGLEKRYPEYALAATSTDDPTPFSTSTGNAALEVGDWLVDNAREDAGGLCWPADLAAAGTAGCDLSIADGNAGIGAFLFGLATYADARVAAGETSLAGRGELYRSTASAAADFIVGQLQAGSCDTTCSYAFLNGQATTGLYHGNAGLAWYLLKTGLETGLTTYRDPAEAILTWLKQDFNRKAVDEGVAWRGTPRSTGASSSDDTLLTDLENGTAGIAWVYLQASLVLDAQKDSSKTQAAGGIDAVSIKNDAWFEEARAAAQWLQGGETAHLFGGAVWWPAEVTPWGVSQYEANWCTDALEVSTDDFRSALVYYPGFMRGGAGIGRFFNVMAGSSLQRNCYRELADQATRWLYYRGENRSWRWPSRVLRFLNTDECSLEPINLETALGYGYGSAGIIAALAEDRFGDEQPLCPAYATILTLPSLATPAEGDVCLE
jgi:hypothetical protein